MYKRNLAQGAADATDKKDLIKKDSAWFTGPSSPAPDDFRIFCWVPEPQNVALLKQIQNLRMAA